MFREKYAQESFRTERGKVAVHWRKLHVEALYILFPFTSYREVARQLQAKFTLRVVPSESEEGLTLLLQG